MSLPYDVPTTPLDPDLEVIGRRFEDVMGGSEPEAPPVDVRAYLLDPPPTAAELERQARRRLLVRRGSVALAALVAIVLVAPWPSGADPQSPAAAPDQPTATSGAVDEPSATTLPVRVDRPVHAPVIHRRHARRRAPAPRQQVPVSTPRVARISVQPRHAAPSPKPASTAPAAPASPGGGVLVPVM
jgi:hypothetical protein